MYYVFMYHGMYVLMYLYVLLHHLIRLSKKALPCPTQRARERLFRKQQLYISYVFFFFFLVPNLSNSLSTSKLSTSLQSFCFYVTIPMAITFSNLLSYNFRKEKYKMKKKKKKKQEQHQINPSHFHTAHTCIHTQVHIHANTSR